MNVLLVGHRGVGKTTVAAHLAGALGWRHLDLDAAIEAATDQSCADLVAADEEAFRSLEVATLDHVLDENDGIVISAGAGLEELPEEPLIVWLDRDGWPATAESERRRLRPELEWPDEVAWMCATREPRWLAAAHLRVNIPRGRPAQRVAHDIATYIRWIDAGLSELAAKTWIVATNTSTLRRAERDAQRFGLAGVEIRSDLFTTFRPLGDTPVLASVRTDDVAWIEAAFGSAAAIDVDLAHLDALAATGVLTGSPRPLILSVHPSGVDPDDVTALAAAVRRIQVEHPRWAEQLSIKYAPQVQGFADIGLGRAALAPFERIGLQTTYLPQGAENAWIRPMLAARNATNYVAATLRPSRVELDDRGRTPWDIQDWLPHLAAPAPTVWDALIGDPVEQSQGDLWHRRAALESGEPSGYIKVGVSVENFEPALAVLAELGVRGVSVTSPLKSRVAFICPNDATFGLLMDDDARWAAARQEAPIRIGNTLLRSNGRWLASDTDEAGMMASLRWFEEREIGPATIALFGGGGVRPALLRAIEASDWFLVFQCRARDGWPEDKPPFVTLVVNAAGPDGGARDNPPKSRGWLDLHYTQVDEVPGNSLHLTGDVFFDAQAAAQRVFWAENHQT